MTPTPGWVYPGAGGLVQEVDVESGGYPVGAGGTHPPGGRGFQPAALDLGGVIENRKRISLSSPLTIVSSMEVSSMRERIQRVASATK